MKLSRKFEHLLLSMVMSVVSILHEFHFFSPKAYFV